MEKNRTDTYHLGIGPRRAGKLHKAELCFIDTDLAAQSRSPAGVRADPDGLAVVRLLREELDLDRELELRA